MNREALIKMFTDRGIDRKDAEGYADGMIAKVDAKGGTAAVAVKLDSAGIRAAFDAVLGKLDETMGQVEGLTGANGKLKAKIDKLLSAADQGFPPDEDESKADAAIDATVALITAGRAAGEDAKLDAIPLAERLAWSADRAQLEQLATAHKVDADEVAKLDTGALRRKVVEVALGDKARTDADDGYFVAMCDTLATQRRGDAAAYAGAFNVQPITPKAGGAKRADADDTAEPVIKHDSYADRLRADFDARKGAN